VHQALVLAQADDIDEADLRLESIAPANRAYIDFNRPFRELKHDVISAFERRYSKGIIEAHFGNVARAARAAGMDRKNLWALLKKYNIDIDAVRRRFGRD
jgi:DNA-binding NtrC family response regulator